MNPNMMQAGVPPQMRQISSKQHIYQKLRAQPAPPGWQQTFRLEQRTSFVHQISTQIFLLKPEMTEPRALEVAFTFEEREFFQSADEQTYKNQCQKKLREIASARQNQANTVNQRLQNQASQGISGQQQLFQPGTVNPNQFQQGPNGMMAQQMSQAQDMARMQAQMQQPQLANALRAQQQNFENIQVPAPIPQQPSQVQGGQTFTPQEKQLIEQKAQEMASKLTEEQRTSIARRMPQFARDHFNAQGLNPIQAFLNAEATKQFRQHKEREKNMQQTHAISMANGGTTQQAPMPHLGMPQQGLNPQQQAQLAGATNIDQQIFAQQQEALRRQQAGQMVVPGNPRQGIPSGVQPSQQNQQQPPQQAPQRPNPSWQIQNSGAFRQQNQALWANGQPRQALNTQSQSGTPNPAAVGQQTSLEGQAGGLTNNVNMRHGQQTPAMPTLNQPMEPPNQAPTGPSPRPSLPNNQPSQKNAQPEAHTQSSDVNTQNAQNTQSNANPQRNGQVAASMIIQNLPQALKAQFASLPTEAHQRQFLMNLQAKSQEHRHRINQAEVVSAQGAQSTPQQPQVTGVPAGAIDKNHLQATANGGRPVNPGGPPIGMQNQVHQGQTAGGRPTGQTGVQAGIALNDEQIRQMDSIDFPPGMRNSIPLLSRLPEPAKTWGHLKLFISQTAPYNVQNFMPRLLQQQAMHFFHIQQNRHKLAQQNIAVPTAQMIPGGQSQPQNVHQMGAATQQLAQTTMQEVQSIRNSIPSAQSMSDEQIRATILARKHQARLSNNPQPNFQSVNPGQQAQYNNMLRLQHMQQNKLQNQGHNPMVQNSQSQPQQAPQKRQQVPKAPQANMNQTNATATEQAKQATVTRGTPQTHQKNLKRNKNNSDDVVEIADPKLSKQTPLNNGVHQTQAIIGNPQLNQRQYDSLSDQQKAQYVAHQQRQNKAVSNQAQQISQAASVIDLSNRTEEIKQANRKLRDIIAEVARAIGRRPSQPMSPQTRGIMIKKLQESKAMMGRLQMALTVFLMMGGNESRLRELVRMHLLLRGQTRDINFTPVENFTITPAELDDLIQKLNNHCDSILSRIAPQQGGLRSVPTQQSVESNSVQKPSINGQQPQQQKPQPQPQPQSKQAANAPQKLTKESLLQHEAIQRSRTATLQKNQNHPKPPAAPTTSTPPIAIGHQSPDGVPHFFNPEPPFTQDKLVLPGHKRKKLNSTSAATTPAQAVQTPGPQSSPPIKVESPKAQRTSAPSKLKCTHIGCKTKTIFATQAELDKHVTEKHPPKEEEITDPLAYCLESFRMVLNLDENGKSKPVDFTASTPDAQASAMKKSASMQSQIMKQEASTPMSRNPTQTGPSPSASLLKTPQTLNNIKTPASETKSTLGNQYAAKPASSKPSPSAPTGDDGWSNTKVPKYWFSSVFSDVTDLNRTVSTDFLVDWLNRNPFNLTNVTDNSSSGAADRQSPHASDISATDNININLSATDGNDDWIPAEWLDDSLSGNGAGGGAEVTNSILDPMLEMDWEAAFGSEQDEEIIANENGAKKLDDGGIVSEEFLKLYAPQELAEGTKRRGRL